MIQNESSNEGDKEFIKDEFMLLRKIWVDEHPPGTLFLYQRNKHSVTSEGDEDDNEIVMLKSATIESIKFWSSRYQKTIIVGMQLRFKFKKLRKLGDD